MMALVRVLSFIIVYLTARNSSLEIYFFIFLVFLYTHYLMQIFYSASSISKIIPFKLSLDDLPKFLCRAILLVILFCVAQYSPWLNMPVYFGLHFLFTEIYAKPLFQNSGLGRFFHYLCCIGIYCFFCRSLVPFSLVPSAVYLAIYTCGLIGLGSQFFINKKHSSDVITSNLGSLFFYEVSGVLFFLIPMQHNTPLASIIFYHVCWWIIYPAIRLLNKEIVFTKWFRFSEVLAVVTAFVAVVFLARNGTYFRYFKDDILFWGNIHITLSFVLSASNPRLINRIFS
jgi:hypothetical protein